MKELCGSGASEQIAKPRGPHRVIDWRIASGLALVLLLASAFLPWLSAPFLGSRSLVADFESFGLVVNVTDLSTLVLAITLYTYLAALILLFLGLMSNARIGAAGGTLGIVSGLVWAISWEIRKDQALQGLSQAGLYGTVGRRLVSMTHVGPGAYLAVTAGGCRNIGVIPQQEEWSINIETLYCFHVIAQRCW